jgi:hypothetical protein
MDMLKRIREHKNELGKNQQLPQRRRNERNRKGCHLQANVLISSL